MGEDVVGFGVTRLRTMLMAVPKGMGLPQLAALVIVAEEPGLSVNDLADRLGCPQQNASRYAAFLLGRYHDDAVEAPALQLIEQRVSDVDPRKRALYLRAEGQDLVFSLLNKLDQKTLKREVR